MDRIQTELILQGSRPGDQPAPQAAPNEPLATVGLFAGIGGIELGLKRSGHTALAFCEIDEAATAVLGDHFPTVPVHPDITSYRRLPEGTTLLTAGFPCQDLSQAGRTLGLEGRRSGLVEEVFWLLRRHDVPWVLLENVPFMLRLQKGRALDVILENLESLSYNWSYRVVDSRAFGLPQRRKRVFILASRVADPRNIILADSANQLSEPFEPNGSACGFYWTEGSRGLGWAVDAVPTLKSGSTIGIPSPPAVWLRNGRIVQPSIRDAERLQGFPPDWTKAAEQVGRPSLRWKLVGNAVTVDVAQWIGERLIAPGTYVPRGDRELLTGHPWPQAAYNVGRGRMVAPVSEFPFMRQRSPLADFLTVEEARDLSLRAVSGFLSRFEASSLSKPPGFLEALRSHQCRMQQKEASKAKASYA